MDEKLKYLIYRLSLYTGCIFLRNYVTLLLVVAFEFLKNKL